MPNLVYMVSGENQEEHKKHWQGFINSPVWKKLRSDPQYKDNMNVDRQHLPEAHARLADLTREVARLSPGTREGRWPESCEMQARFPGLREFCCLRILASTCRRGSDKRDQATDIKSWRSGLLDSHVVCFVIDCTVRDLRSILTCRRFVDSRFSSRCPGLECNCPFGVKSKQRNIKTCTVGLVWVAVTRCPV